VINGLFLTRIVDDKAEPVRSSFPLQFLIVLTTAMMLMYKLMHLREFPAVWREHKRLLVEQRQLAERHRMLSEVAQPAAGSGSDSDAETAPMHGCGVRDVDPQAATERFDDGHPVPGRLCATSLSQELSLEYDTQSDRVAVSLSGLRSHGVSLGTAGSAPETGRPALHSSHSQPGACYD
jgi:hypothetical protein